MHTIRDVARDAGVGLGTVSRVLSGSPHVAVATRERVIAAIARLDYRPSVAARALRRQRTGTLEVIVPLFTREFYVEVLRGIAAGVAASDYALVIRTVERPADRARVFGQCGAPGSADGVVIVSLRPPAELVERLSTAIATVLIDSRAGQLPRVIVDHEAASQAAVQHLLDLGHRHIALIDHAADPFAPTARSGRQVGFRRALTQAGIPLRPAHEQVTDYSPEGGARALHDLWATPVRPTAVFVGSDVQALGVIDAARRQNIRVPDDLSVVGYNDIEVAQFLGLTTVQIPMRELGRQGAALLVAALAGQAAVATPPPLRGTLMIRRTTAPPAGKDIIQRAKS